METEQKHTKPTSFGVRLFRAVVVAGIIAALSWFVWGAATGQGSFAFKRGLDIAGGTRLTYVADTSGVESSQISANMDVLRDVIEKRVNLFGVSEPLVYTETGSAVSDAPKNRLVVELPGVTDVEEAIKQIGKTPHLEFKLVNSDPVVVAAQQKLAEGDTSALTQADKEALTNAYLPTGLTGAYVSNAQVSYTRGQGVSEPVVNLTFNSEGSDLFGKITDEHVGERLAIFLDGQPLSQPRINEPIHGGTAQISGSFTLQSAKELAEGLTFGSLPIPISLAQHQSVDGSLGSRVLDDGAKAGMIGFAFLALMLIVWYRASGLVSVLALFSYVVMLLALVLVVPVTLTAAGIAGLILSMGMAIDANVLIFERFKEEYRKGRRVHDAITDAFTRAWPAIRDGNITTLIAAVVLYWFGTSFVQGFAFMLILGIFVSMLSALVITRAFARLFPNIRLADKGIVARLLNTGIGR